MFNIDAWKIERVVDNKNFRALLTDVSKAFDFISYDLLIATFNSFGSSLSASKLIYNSLLNREQRTEIDFFCISWDKILAGVAQGSILGSLLF